MITIVINSIDKISLKFHKEFDWNASKLPIIIHRAEAYEFLIEQKLFVSDSINTNATNDNTFVIWRRE